MNQSELLASSNRAITNGDHLRALKLLRQYNVGNTEDAALWHRQALLEEEIGDWTTAGLAHQRCIALAQNNTFGYLYFGAWLKMDNQIELSAAAFSLAQDTDPSSLLLWQSAHTSEPTRERSKIGYDVLSSFLSKHHKDSVSNNLGVSYVTKSLWTRTNIGKVEFDEPSFSPELFFIPSIERKPIYQPSEFKWATNLINQFDSIKHEFNLALKEIDTERMLRPYLAKKTILENSLQALAGSLDWSALDLYKDGVLNQDISSHFPNTLNALKEIPTYGLNERPFEAFFSILKPRQTIAPHFGQSNHSLNVHLPISIPENCHFSVADKHYNWSEGELLIFDDCYRHSAHNLSDESRVVLIFSVWHPELNSNDQRLVKNCFNARRNWLDNRFVQLSQPLKNPY